jgi:hypothetical protein
VKLLCEDPAFGEYIKCILMDERTFLNNNMAYSFLTCFLHKVAILEPSLPSVYFNADSLCFSPFIACNFISASNDEVQPLPRFHV